MRSDIVCAEIEKTIQNRQASCIKKLKVSFFLKTKDRPQCNVAFMLKPNPVV